MKARDWSETMVGRWLWRWASSWKEGGWYLTRDSGFGIGYKGKFYWSNGG